MAFGDMNRKETKEFKFSPTLRPELDGDLIEFNPKKKKGKNYQFDVFGSQNKITEIILAERKKVEESFGTKLFAKTYSQYVGYLDALFVYVLGYLASDSKYEQEHRQIVKSYIESPQYRRLPYEVKNTIVFRFNQPATIEEIFNQIKKSELMTSEITLLLSQLLQEYTKIVTQKMQQYLEDMLEKVKSIK